MTPDRRGLERQFAAMRDALEASRQEVRALRDSTSWRITAPLRAVMNRLRGVQAAPAGAPALVAVTDTDNGPLTEDVVARFGSWMEWQAWRDAHGSALSPGAGTAIASNALRAGLVTPLLGEVPPEGVTLVGDDPREGLLALGLNARLRATLAVLAWHPRAADVWGLRIYAHEALTPFALGLRGRYPRFVGSEYAKDAEAERALWPIPAVDIERSAFPDGGFEVVLSNEVFEHVPDLDAALRDTRRILCEGGWLVATFPFNWEAEATETRARLAPGGEVEHLAPPEYHGNPVDPEGGSLVFQVPGWDVLPRCRAAGFSTARMVFIGSARHGICSRDIPGVFVLLAEA
jgi:SAM-dependent methyltransferase